MCIISNPIESVSATKILIAPNYKLNRQLTVYSNNVNNTSNNNAMILPVPNPQTIKLHDLSNYTQLFDDCNACFINNTNFGRGNYSTNSTNSFSLKLPIFNVGSYQASIALSLEDIKRVDSSVFTLSDGCYELLLKEYSNPIFGFIICKLENSQKKYHPFAYSNDIYNNKLFIPTKHYHGHTPSYEISYMPTVSNINDSPMFRNTSNYLSNKEINFFEKDLISPDWDHYIYLYNATSESNSDFVTMQNKYRYVWSGENEIKLNKIDFDFGQLAHFEKHQIIGKHKNIDLYIDYKNNWLTNNWLTNQFNKLNKVV